MENENENIIVSSIVSTNDTVTNLQQPKPDLFGTPTAQPQEPSPTQPKQEAKPKVKSAWATDEFNAVWELFAYKKSKKDAIIAWRKIPPILYPGIMSAIPKYLADIRAKGTTQAHLASWLNGERWNDEYPEPPPIATDQQKQNAKKFEGAGTINDPNATSEEFKERQRLEQERIKEILNSSK